MDHPSLVLQASSYTYDYKSDGHSVWLMQFITVMPHPPSLVVGGDFDGGLTPLWERHLPYMGIHLHICVDGRLPL